MTEKFRIVTELFFGDVGVDLGSGDGAVSEEFLDLADVAHPHC